MIQRTLDSVSEFIGDNYVLVGSRPFWDALFDYLKLTDDQKKEIFILIDKRDKIGDQEFAEWLSDVLKNEKCDYQILKNPNVRE